MRKKLVIIFCFAFLCLAPDVTSADSAPEVVLSYQRFVQLATENDSEFEEILVDELTLQYQKKLRLPAKDLVLSVKSQYEMFLDQDRSSPDTTVGLSKLFPMSGTELSADYEVGAGISSSQESSSVTFALSQPIAQNAFGRSTKIGRAHV